MTTFTLNSELHLGDIPKPFTEFSIKIVNTISSALVKIGENSDYYNVINYLTKTIDPLLITYYRKMLPEVASTDWEEQVKKIESGLNENKIPFSQKSRSYEAIALVRYADENNLYRYDYTATELRSIFKYDKVYFDQIMSTVLPTIERLAKSES